MQQGAAAAGGAAGAGSLAQTARCVARTILRADFLAGDTLALYGEATDSQAQRDEREIKRASGSQRQTSASGGSQCNGGTEESGAWAQGGRAR